MRRLAILLAVLLLPGCVHHPGAFGYGSGPFVHSHGHYVPAWRPPRWHAPPPWHWHGSPGWHRHGPPRWHGHFYSYRPHRHHDWR